ncbi:hypothetical protein PAGA_a1496 [Pseudoalteromonas agarivorans DSM 14585]|uniref:Uncharacterized protein n=1 Tax=Pseudoalteromonas agarivorans DSM 14585 TaxID=1312369 RepID=A0ACA8DV90_9GAMM|nr:hypothetical protein PAGA_a1496 [Pseudoalteromonas agarivorans DSM 14585]
MQVKITTVAYRAVSFKQHVINKKAALSGFFVPVYHLLSIRFIK